MWRTVELRELLVFLTLAEELHFGRTADRLRITSSRVSQSLRTLEDKLGTGLVHRTSRQVALTPAGERFLRDIAPAYQELAAVLERANATARELEGSLRLGVLSGPAAGPRLVELVRAFEELHPECAVEIVPMSWHDPFGGLRRHDVDLMAAWVPHEQADLVVGPTLTKQPRVLAVGPHHPLADRDAVDVEELADHPVVRFDDWPDELRDLVVPSRTPRGRPIPGTAVPVDELTNVDLPVRLARGEHAFPTVESAAPWMGSLELRFVPITGMPPLRSALVWRRPARDPRLRAFIRVARDMLRS